LGEKRIPRGRSLWSQTPWVEAGLLANAAASISMGKAVNRWRRKVRVIVATSS
jgi:hypothetical protein